MIEGKTKSTRKKVVEETACQAPCQKPTKETLEVSNLIEMALSHLVLLGVGQMISKKYRARRRRRKKVAKERRSMMKT